MFIQLGNKVKVLHQIIDILEYIDKEQNSPDMYPYKQMLLKMGSAIMNGLSTDESQVTQVAQYNPPTKPAERADEGCGSGCDCGDSQECSIPMMQPQTPNKERIIPEFNIQETIEKIKGELNATKN